MSMRILVAAKELRLDRGSEGICSSKFVLALSRAGHEVSCLTSEDVPAGEDLSGFSLPWLKSVRIKHINAHRDGGVWTRLAGLSESLAATGKPGAYAGRKLDGAFVYGTGYRPRVWRQVDCWSHAIRREAEKERPDLIFLRGAGDGFEPHMALLKGRCAVPWVANYHDPFPISLYPEPYRSRSPLISDRQESIHRRIIAAADALTFPSRRLLEWVLRGDLEGYRSKALVIPHLATELPVPPSSGGKAGLPSLRSDDFNIIHTGTLLGPRDPRALLRGFLEFVNQDGEKRRRARLIFVGRIIGENRQLLASDEWSRLKEGGGLIFLDERVSYHQALDISGAATAVVLLEADSPESPFFPAKLTDYLWLRKPILALSPARSATGDILGPDYQLRVAPADSRGVTMALNTLWRHWAAGRLDELVPAQSLLNSISEATVRAQLEAIFVVATSSLQSRHRRR